VAIKISIIIPAYNEAENIAALINYLKQNSKNSGTEIIVSDGGSTDETQYLAASAGATVLASPQKGRAAQMNFGAAAANGNILYFVHADCLPPVNFINDIYDAVTKGFDCGRYRTKFNSPELRYKFNAFFTRFDWFICYGGDQTFFITRSLFDSINGFNSSMKIMEEYDLTTRAKRNGHYKIFKDEALVSVRKYEGRGWWRVQKANSKAIALYKAGASQEEIVLAYKKMLG
jgi:rSAM/selenodomain-associated transferase 2